MLNSAESRVLDHAWIFLSILFTACSQLLIKWQVSQVGALPAGTGDRLHYMIELFTRPWILVALASTFLAGVTWMIALGKFELSYAFPFYALNFLIIFMSGIFFFAESLTVPKVVGLLLILVGTVVLAGGGNGKVVP
jgi:multidrug transporter EmrE-like cation transporter